MTYTIEQEIAQLEDEAEMLEHNGQDAEARQKRVRVSELRRQLEDRAWPKD